MKVDKILIPKIIVTWYIAMFLFTLLIFMFVVSQYDDLVTDAERCYDTYLCKIGTGKYVPCPYSVNNTLDYPYGTDKERYQLNLDKYRLG